MVLMSQLIHNLQQIRKGPVCILSGKKLHKKVSVYTQTKCIFLTFLDSSLCVKVQENKDNKCYQYLPLEAFNWRVQSKISLRKLYVQLLLSCFLKKQYLIGTKVGLNHFHTNEERKERRKESPTVTRMFLDCIVS